LAKAGLSSFLLFLCLISGCSSSTSPSFQKEDIAKAVYDLCRQEFKLDATVRLVGSTLWIYLPLEDIFKPSDKPEKRIERFEIIKNQVEFKDDRILESSYMVLSIPEKEKRQGIKYNTGVSEKINGVWNIIRRVLFSMERSGKNEPQFISFITADVKNGYELTELSYYLDLKKISYGFISSGEYQHRSPQDMNMSPEIINDIKARHIDFTDISFKEFIRRQIENRVRMKFQKPEVQKNADIDKEIMRIVSTTLKTYNFNDFSEAEFRNLFTRNRIILNRKAILTSPID
jgi:hypothetical protein